MPRRRLYGETQKRRQKAQTAQLKRGGSPHRVEATHAPAEFERSERLDRQDVEFLEAMRELRVRPNPRRAIPPSRLREIRQVQLEDETSAGAEFLSAMEHLGVRPRNGSSRPETPGAARPAIPEPAPPKAGPASTPESPSRRPLERGDAGKQTPKDAALAGAPHKAGGATPPEPVLFEDDGRSMADLLPVALDPHDKYEGAVARTGPPRREVRVQADAIADPDDTLDLHGKTQEEAIRMVQNFLLTAHRRRCRAVLIITGRGIRSGGHGPVLGEAVRRWLERNGERFVREFHTAPGRHGGEGAIWVTMA